VTKVGSGRPAPGGTECPQVVLEAVFEQVPDAGIRGGKEAGTNRQRPCGTPRYKPERRSRTPLFGTLTCRYGLWTYQQDLVPVQKSLLGLAKQLIATERDQSLWLRRQS
jgi:hypothetical protein